MRGKVLLIDRNHDGLAAGLTALGYECIEGYDWNYQTTKEQLHEFVGLVIRSRFKIDATLIDAGKQLEWIARPGAGLENIDVHFAESKGIACLRSPEGNRNAVSEHALGMLLALFNHLFRADQQVRQGTWIRGGNRGYELDGKTIGIIGFGYMGEAFAKKLSGFDITILAHDKYKKNFLPSEAHFPFQNAGYSIHECTLERIQQEADVISLHLPETPETFHYIDDAFVDTCAKPFYLINTARGKNVDTGALLKALDSGKIIGACLDVLEQEQSSFENLFGAETLPNELAQLLKNDRVILSPHIAGWTHESNRKMAEIIVEKVKALNDHL